MHMVEVPKIEFQEKRLDNGLRVVIHRDSRVPLVHLSIHYRVGSSYETPGRSGLAHLFEHMMFQGSENVAKNEHFRHIDYAGGRCNASTGKDRTNYYETVPSNYLDLALWLEADRMRSLEVTGENFENQRQTVIEEKKQSYDNQPYGLATLRFDELAYRNWAYAHPIIGSVEDLEESTLEDAVDFHGVFYRPENAVLVLCGDLDGDGFEKVARYFADIPTRSRPAAPDLREPEQTGERLERMRDPLAPLPAVYLGYHMPELGSPEYYALSVLGLILSHGESSRFYQRFVYENNWISHFSLGPNQYRGPEIFYVWFQTQDQIDVDSVTKQVVEELLGIGNQPVSEEEMEKAKNQMASFFVGRLSKLSRIGELLAHYALFFEDPAEINLDLGRYLKITEEDMIEAARAVFRAENQTSIVVEPGTS